MQRFFRHYRKLIDSKTDKSEQERLIQQYQTLSADKTICKFVPASGAASRMFKALFAFMSEYSGSDEEYDKFSSGQTHSDVFHFFKHISWVYFIV